MVYDLDSIKQRNSIAEIIAAHGVALRESGSHLVGRCPFTRTSTRASPSTRRRAASTASAATPAVTSLTSSAAPTT